MCTFAIVISIIVLSISCNTGIIVGIGKKSYGFQIFRTLKINLAIGFSKKTCFSALALL